ncbi:MAG: T9SS type A sorting domain-containing protein [Saprospiraceae bacterium]|nr:T9SS type A sorting domain-containing protein [Saprospiraceae bacterium]
MKNNMLSLALVLLFPALATAQKPVSKPLKTSNTLQNQQDWSCNDAGTIEVGQFIGQSTDTDLYQIFLCFGDSIEIKHNGDADLSGDPNVATQPGIGYVFYNCPPGISGPTLPDIANDPCILQGGSILFFTTQGVQNGGDTWFFNDGSLQNIFNQGQPLSLFFAPITMDDYVSNAYESGQLGMPPGPCVDVNIDEAFEVVYLNKISATGIDNNFGNDCLGRFTVRNGYPQYENSETYAIDISLTSNPDVKAQVMTTSGAIFHLSSVTFSVCQPGLYTVSLEDGKSCGHLFQMDMSGCNATDNVALNFEEVSGVPGETVCVPLQVANFNVESGSFSITWNPVLLHFTEINQINPAFANLIDTNIFVNTALANTGNLGVLFYNALSPDELFQVPDGESLFEVCFEVLDTTWSDCIAIGISNSVAGISMQDSLGQNLGVCAAEGGICKSVTTSELFGWEMSNIFPNPVKAGEPAFLDLVVTKSTMAQLSISNTKGEKVKAKEIELVVGENRVVLPTIFLLPGIYFATVSGPNAVLATCKVVIL